MNGLRIGTPEIVRWGMTDDDMPELAGADCPGPAQATIPSEQVAADVTAFRRRFTQAALRELTARHRTGALPVFFDNKGNAAMRIVLRMMTAALMAAGAIGIARADIVVGVAGPMSGPNAAYGEQYRVGVETAVERINANGGVLGQKLVISVGDDVSDPKQGVSVANKFVADQVRYVVGHFNSGVTIPASDVYAENGVLFVTPTATNPMVTDRGLWDAFRACGRDDQQGIDRGKVRARAISRTRRSRSSMTSRRPAKAWPTR